MSEARVLALTGMLGSGFLESSLARALDREPHVIGCDAGTTDSGAASLGTGTPAFSRAAVKHDLTFGLQAARRKGIPIMVGSAGTAGADTHLEWTTDIVREIAREQGLHFSMAVIHAEQDKRLVKRKLAAGRILPLQPIVPCDDAVIDRTSRVVAMMGVEPLMAALDQGADVVIAGRCSDTAIFAAVPLLRGLPPGPVWHAAKILECGAACVTVRHAADCMFALIDDDGFVVDPPNPEHACTPLSVAAHTLYENANPFLFTEPSGTVDVSGAAYKPVSDRAVQVTGSRYVPGATYTVKLEGAEQVGFQSIVLGGIRDPALIAAIDSWLVGLRERVDEALQTRLKANGDCKFTIRIYGKNGVMAASEPERNSRSHELLLILEMTATTQSLATAAVMTARHIALHLPIPGWQGHVSTLAFPYAPAHIERGPVYRFTMNSVMALDSPLEVFPMDLEVL